MRGNNVRRMFIWCGFSKIRCTNKTKNSTINACIIMVCLCESSISLSLTPTLNSECRSVNVTNISPMAKRSIIIQQANKKNAIGIWHQDNKISSCADLSVWLLLYISHHHSSLIGKTHRKNFGNKTQKKPPDACKMNEMPANIDWSIEVCHHHFQRHQIVDINPFFVEFVVHLTFDCLLPIWRLLWCYYIPVCS